MTTGIYKLTFEGTKKVYIGQSGNCEARYTQHKNKLLKHKAPKKLQEAYNLYGMPIFSILDICSLDKLDDLEVSRIKEYNSYKEGFNNTEGGDATPILRGIDNGNALYTVEDYWNVLYFLGIPGYSWKEIEKETGVSHSVISHISSGESHHWLADKFPEEYEKLEVIRNSEIGRKSAFMQGIRYPRIISPEGIEYEVTHCTNFAKEHNLLQPKLHGVLTGTRGHHKGWHLKEYIKPIDYPSIISPEGVIYTIPFNSAAKFAREHNLTHSLLHRVLKGSLKSHKGWKLQ